MVDETLSVMHVGILRITTQAHWFRRILKVEKDKTSTASTGSWCSTNRHTVAKLFVDDNVVSSSSWKISKVTSQTTPDSVVESHWAGWVDGEKLSHVEDLDTVVLELGSDKHVVLVGTDFVPDGVVSDRGI